MRLEALVAAASTPRLSGAHQGRVQLVVRPPGAPLRSVSHECLIRYEQWLVPGMTVPITIDPAEPARLRIEWDEVPSIHERIAANDPALVDPIGARRRARAAVHEASLVPEARGQLPQLPDGDGEGERDPAQYSGPPNAPDGRLRGLAWRVSETARDVEERDAREYRGEMLLAVRLPGRPPYATLKREWIGRLRGDILGSGLPVLVDPADRNNVEILWDELPDVREQVGTSVGRQLAQAAQQQAELQHQQLARTFAAIPDPQQRQVLAEQLRAQGMVIEDAWLAAPRADDRLAKLAALRDSGVLTQAEYDAQVARLSE